MYIHVHVCTIFVPHSLSLCSLISCPINLHVTDSLCLFCLLSPPLSLSPLSLSLPPLSLPSLSLRKLLKVSYVVVLTSQRWSHSFMKHLLTFLNMWLVSFQRYVYYVHVHVQYICVCMCVYMISIANIISFINDVTTHD